MTANGDSPRRRPGLLIVACSQRKRDSPGLMPAIERYDGPSFRLIRRFLRSGMDAPTIAILSAEFGLILGDRPIPWYDRRMTAERARILGTDVGENLRVIICTNTFREIFVCMGRTYRAALPDLASLNLPIQFTSGTIGYQLAALHDWLYGEPPVSPRPESIGNVRGGVRLRSIQIDLTTEQVLMRARSALALDRGDTEAFHAWYVLVDGRRIAPKWLVSQLTRLPVSTFTTDEARRVLAQLGIEVHRA